MEVVDADSRLLAAFKNFAHTVIVAGTLKFEAEVNYSASLEETMDVVDGFRRVSVSQNKLSLEIMPFDRPSIFNNLKFNRPSPLEGPRKDVGMR